MIGLSHLLELLEVSISRCAMLELDLHLEGLNSLKRIISYEVNQAFQLHCKPSESDLAFNRATSFSMNEMY